MLLHTFLSTWKAFLFHQKSRLNCFIVVFSSIIFSVFVGTMWGFLFDLFFTFSSPNIFDNLKNEEKAITSLINRITHEMHNLNICFHASYRRGESERELGRDGVRRRNYDDEFPSLQKRTSQNVCLRRKTY